MKSVSGREGADQLVIGLASVVDRFDRPKLPIGFGPTVRKGQQAAVRINGTERTPLPQLSDRPRNLRVTQFDDRHFATDFVRDDIAIVERQS